MSILYIYLVFEVAQMFLYYTWKDFDLLLMVSVTIFVLVCMFNKDLFYF